jgi:hypothetical protein
MEAMAECRLDAAVELFDGQQINGVVGLRNALLRYSPQFVRVVTEKLMTYGLGRGVEYYDMPVIRSIVRDAGKNNNKFSSIVLGIVKSAPFQMRSSWMRALRTNKELPRRPDNVYHKETRSSPNVSARLRCHASFATAGVNAARTNASA